MKKESPALLCGLALMIILISTQLQALDSFGFDVFDGEINKVGHYSLSTQYNNVLSGTNQVDYPGQLPNHQQSHWTVEVARGINKYWETGLAFMSATLPNGYSYFGGIKFRNEIVVPRKDSGDWQFGVNFEFSYTPQNIAPNFWAFEIRPIMGYSWRRVSFSFNPILDFNLVNNLEQPPDFSPAAKLVYDTHKGFGLGFEYFDDSGNLPALLPWGQSEQYLFFAFDLLKGPFEFNAGLGGGLNTPANVYSNATIGKLAFGFIF